mgnify:CR=1
RTVSEKMIEKLFSKIWFFDFLDTSIKISGINFDYGNLLPQSSY